MSAILSTDDLNDFINPGVACIKPIETLPQQRPANGINPLEVTTEDELNPGSKVPPAQISLTDCLACSGCVTSAEAVLISLQSHGEVLDTLDKYKELRLDNLNDATLSERSQAKLFVASISPQARASLAATYDVSERQAGNMIDQLLCGPQGLRSGGQHGTGFAWTIDTNAMRDASLVAAAEEMDRRPTAGQGQQPQPIITSACPGWICYAEKTHPHVLPHLSKLKSPQALTGVLLKSVLAARFGLAPDNVWHLAVMPCFDKKLEASRSELTSRSWHGVDGDAVRDVDCVITARELLMLAESRDVSFPRLPKRPVIEGQTRKFPDSTIHDYLFKHPRGRKRKREDIESIGTSGGYLYHILRTKQAQHPGSVIKPQQGRNNDVSEYAVIDPDGTIIFKAARYYGFRNIQNLVRKLKPVKASRIPGASSRKVGALKPKNMTTAGSSTNDYAYVEVMACPGGCTNGGGQIKIGDAATLRQAVDTGLVNGNAEQYVSPTPREWLAKVDEAYWSADSEKSEVNIGMDGDLEEEQSSGTNSVISNGNLPKNGDVVDGIDHQYVRDFLQHWSRVTGIDPNLLLKTTYRVVESDVGKSKGSGDFDRVNAIAHSAGGGW